MTNGTGNDTPTHEAHRSGADIYQFTPPPPTTEELAGAAALRRARRKRRLRRTAAGLAVVIGGSTGTAVAALSTAGAGQAPSLTAANVATTGTTGTTQPSTTPPGPSLPGMRGRERWGVGAMARPFGPAAMGRTVVHGTYTVKTASGSFQTVQVQTGTATNVTATSIEVTSADGFTQSYAVSASTLVDAGSSGITSVNHGDNVVVQATVSGSTLTAQRVVDVTQVGAERNRWPGGGGAGPDWSGPNGGGPAPAA